MKSNGKKNSFDPKEILVAIPTLNEEKYIRKTILSLIGSNLNNLETKIVVADGGSSDRTCEIVIELAKTFPNIQLIQNRQRLQSAAINLVVNEAAEEHHEFLVRVDAHSIYPEDYIFKVVQSMITNNVEAVATVMDSVGINCFQRGAAWAMDTPLGTGGSSHRGGKRSHFVDHGHHAGFRLEIWRKVGGYNTKFVANEDAELDYRIRMAGGKIWLDATIRIDYVMRGSILKLSRQYFRYGWGRAQTTILHKKAPKFRQFFPPLFFVTNIIAILFGFIYSFLFFIPLSYVFLLFSTSLFLMLKNKSICGICAGPALSAMHLSWSFGFISYMVHMWFNRNED
ncbi:glycosyltransferase family 2 protein [Donghicola mangrovi]|uniref:Glycosyltransferase family 2 protein n=1 Tax=Donghicola mangrovi TaxID=2729614 RepID=A0A850Q1Y2_9RHOB|nr:glycosyltransferase family 2 protein [Donghicola mangrovi]NVO23003.1 glycosyltransferase family 2 protein [Donghicola mangrovi]